MFYIQTSNGISITEAGRSPLFISKSNPFFDSIKLNIKTMTYNQIQDAIDVKGKVAGVVTEEMESYINADDALEVQMNVQEFSNSWKDQAVTRLVEAVKDDTDEEHLDEKSKTLVELLNSGGLKLVGIKLIFE